MFAPSLPENLQGDGTVKYSITFVCPECDGFHFTENRDGDDVLMRAATIPISECAKCTKFHNFVQGVQ